MKRDIIRQYNFAGIELAAIIQVLDEFNYTGVLKSTSRNIASIRGFVFIYLILRNGKIDLCCIESGDGRSRFTGEEALQSILHLASLEWTAISYEPILPPLPGHEMLYLPIPGTSDISPSSVVSSTPEQDDMEEKQRAFFSVIPSRIAKMSQQQLDALSRQHRMILALIDEKRDVGEIASLMGLSNHKIRAMLDELQSMKVISITKKT